MPYPRHAGSSVQGWRRRPAAKSGGPSVYPRTMAAGNPFRVWLEYLANWTLIERSDSDIRRLCADAGLGPPAIERDSTGLALLITAASP
ncbi:MAG TPA: hypothetical protein VFK57_21680 [Vicinamibacterales bacterium]|nr:hypothetical protein [Vicinamibacterales bacterium]